MKLGFHGGLCCGVKTIYGFGESIYVREGTQYEREGDDRDKFGKGFHTDTDHFFTDYAPDETIEKRLDRLISFCRYHRPQGMIEAILIVGYQTDVWHDILIDHGFKVYVPDWVNSNSDNTLRLYNLIYDDCPEYEEEEDDDDYE